MAYDSARGVTILFGSDGTSDIAETWEWDGTMWMLRNNTATFSRAQHAMAYDSTRRVTRLFGGVANNDSSQSTWEWDGATWTQRSTDGPSPRFGQAMAHDNGRGLTVLFGGYDAGSYKGDTWEFGNRMLDGDCDGDLDLGDVAAFLRCFSPSEPTKVGCERFDTSGDEGVDLADFAGLADELTGPMLPLAP